MDFETGLQAVEELRALVPPGATMAELALRWILMFDDVTCAIAGAKRPAQAEDNIRAADLPPLSDETMERHPRASTTDTSARRCITCGSARPETTEAIS